MKKEQKIREALRKFMAEKDLTITEVARLINRSPWTVWGFLNGKTKKPHFRTLIRISQLIEKNPAEGDQKEVKG